MAITIIGYRGTGKTTVGSELAQRLGWSHLDTDPAVERRAGKSISAIFAEHGEPHFRDLESSELANALSQAEIVVSSGGGAILSDANRALMSSHGPVVWLTADVGTIASRIQTDATSEQRRPSLTNTDPISEIQQVLAQRAPLYEEAATIIIRTDNRSPTSIVDEILSLLPQ